MSKKSRRNQLETSQLRNEMRRLKQMGETSERIMLLFKLDRDNYDYHMSQIYIEDKKQLKQYSTRLMANELLTCKARMERSISTLEDIARNKSNKPDERNNAEKLKSEISINIVRLMSEGPALLGLEQSNIDIGEADVSIHNEPIQTAMDKLFTQQLS